MIFIDQLRALSPLRRNQQKMAFCLLFVNALLGATSITLYVDLFTSDGLIVKNYIVSVAGLALFVPLLGRMTTTRPLQVFYTCVVLEGISMLAWYATLYSPYPHVALGIASAAIVSAGLAMSPILKQVESIVTDGCADYSLLSTRLSAAYTALAALIGAAFVYYSLPLVVNVTVFSLALAMARYYRKRVLDDIYGQPQPDTNNTTPMPCDTAPANLTQ